MQQITTEEKLKGKFKLFFPTMEYSEALIPRKNGEEKLKIKQVDGLGTYLYYSRQGKRQFHEHILDYITEELKKQGTRYKRSRKNIGADLEIGKTKVELEIRSNPPKEPENRANFLGRLKQHPETTIIIVLNRKDKARYTHSRAREIITGNNKFLTLQEFLEKTEKLFKTSRQTKIL